MAKQNIQPKTKIMKKLLIAIIVLSSFSSCSNYYKVVLAPQPENASDINDLKAKDRYFILRNGTEAFRMNTIAVSADQKNIQCSLETLPFEHRLHINNGGNSNMKYTKSKTAGDDESSVLNEVHIYITPDSNIVSGPYTLAFNKVNKTEILEANKAKTKRSHTLGLVLGISLPIVIVAGIAAIAISSSLAHGF